MSNKLIYLISFVLVLGMASTGLAQLEGYWPLDGDLLDASGNARHGTWMGDPNAVLDANAFEPGAAGLGLTFNGTDEYVNIDGYKGIGAIDGVQQEFSIANWFKIAPGASDGNVEMVTWGSSPAPTRLTWRVHQGRLRTEHGSGNLRGNTYVDDGEWHHGALVVTEGANLRVPATRLYVDGVEDTIFSGSNNAYNLGSDADVSLGRRADNDSRYWPGSLDEVYIFSRVLDADMVPQVMNGIVPSWPKADKPSPADGAMLEEVSTFLEWRAGQDSVSHDIYFGTTADLGLDQLVSQQADAKYLAAGIVPDQTYYWRVDEIDADGVVTTGDVYSFWTPVRGAWDPQPADGLSILGDAATLTWAGGWSPILHNVHFGTDPAALVPVSMMQTDLTYDSGPLEPDTTYYWRIDEFYGVDTVTGPLWSFTTLPVLPASGDPNLIIQYTFDQVSNNIVLDESGNANHGEMFDGAEVTTGGPAGDATLDLEGEFEYVAISGLHYDNAPQAETTVSAWIRTDLGSNQTIASFDRNEYWRFQINGEVATDGQIGWHMWTDAQSDYGSVRRVDDGIWHHVCGVYDNGEQIIYIDGVAEPSVMSGTTFGRNVRWGYIGTGSEAGVYNGTPRTPADHFDGQIDDFRIYDRALTADEIQQLGRLDPDQAWAPTPISASSADIWGVASLSWTPGDSATEHDVYFGADSAAVEAADASDATGVYRGRQAEASYALTDKLDFDTTYFWRVDEVAADGTVTAGRLWSLRTEADLVVADVNAPFDYDNSVDPFVSELAVALDPALDLTDPIVRLAVSYTGNPPAGSVTVGDVNGIATTTVVGRGDDIFGTADEFQYAYTTLAGNGSMTVKIDSLDHTNDWTKAGIMIRETLDPGSPFAAVYLTGANGVISENRPMPNQDVDNSGNATRPDEVKALTAPVWIKIERTFPMVNVSYSTDGVAFIPLGGPQVIPMLPPPLPINIGLAVTSHSGAETYATAVFSEITSDGGVMPGPLTSLEIGLEGNSAEPMYLVLEDASGASAAVMNPDPAATQQTSATDFTVELADFAVDLTAVAKVSLVIGNLDAPAPGGSGSLTINNVRLLAKQPLLVMISGDHDDDGDGVPDDFMWPGIFEAAGYKVDYQPGIWKELDDAKIATLNAADLIVITRGTNSGDYDDGDEVAQWNAITTPILSSATHIMRNSRWKWVDSGSLLNLTPAVMELADGTQIDAIDEAVGISNFIDGAPGNGTVLATGDGVPWIIEWEAGVEFYDGAGQIAGGPRVFFVAGTQNTTDVSGWGEWNLTAAGEALYLDIASGLLD